MFLVKNGKNALITVIPATFMSAVTMTFAMSSPLYFGKIGFLAANAKWLGLVVAAAFLVIFLVAASKAKKEMKLAK